MSKLALVTGASSGFGRAIAIELSKVGYELILLARRETKLLELKDQLNTQAHCLLADVNDRKALVKKLACLPSELKNIDLLVNNAGLALGVSSAQESDWRDWQTMIETNCMALAFMTRQLLPNMVERNSGHVINIGSTAGSHAYKGGNVYGASKAFVDQFSAGLRSDLLGTMVRVTNVVPGLAGGTEFSDVRYHGDQRQAQEVYRGCEPLTAQDIARSVCWVAQQPEHMNVNRLEVMPTCQASAGLAVHKE